MLEVGTSTWEFWGYDSAQKFMPVRGQEAWQTLNSLALDENQITLTLAPNRTLNILPLMHISGQMSTVTVVPITMWRHLQGAPNSRDEPGRAIWEPGLVAQLCSRLSGWQGPACCV